MARKKKRTASPILIAWSSCRNDVGAKPFVKMSKKQKRAAKACVSKKLARMGKK